MDILSALNILRTASDDALKCHAAETVSTLRKVGERLQANFLPNTPYESASEGSTSRSCYSIASTPSPLREINAVSSSSANSDSRTGISDDRILSSLCDVSQPTSLVIIPPFEKVPRVKSREQTNDLVSKLVRAIKRTTPWIWETSNKELDFITSRKRKSGEDPRLEDVRRIEGDPGTDEKDKLLRLLAITSLASEFTTEQSRDKRTKVDELVAYVHSVEAGNEEDQPDASLKGRRSDISDFVKRRPHILVAQKLANSAINNGIKHLVFEQILKHRLQKHHLPDTCEAVSVILGLNINNFRSLPYRKMPDLLDVILADDMKISLRREGAPEGERSFVEIIRDLDPWYTKLRAKYNDNSSRAFAPEPEPHCAKRPRRTHRSVDSPTYRGDSNVSHPMTTELETASIRDTETNAEIGFQCLNEVPVPDTRSSPNGECPPFEDFDPFQDFNPFQELFQDFNPFQDFNTVPEFDLVIPHVPSDAIPDTTEEFFQDCLSTRRLVPADPGQDGQVNSQKGGTAYISSSTNISIPQTVC